MDSPKTTRCVDILPVIFTYIAIYIAICIGWRTVGLIPILNASKATKETDAYRQWKAVMYHECWRRLLLSLEEVRKAEGIYLDICGQRRMLVPEIAFISQDSQEVRNNTHTPSRTSIVILHICFPYHLIISRAEILHYILCYIDILRAFLTP